MAQRISRKSIKEDEFIEAAFDAGAWIEKHGKLVAFVAAGALVVVVLFASWHWWSSRRGERARALVAEGMLLYGAVPDVQRAAGGVSPGTAPRYDEALATFEKAAIQGRGLPEGDVASFYRGAAMLRLGRAREAAGVLEDLMSRKRSGPVGDGAQALLAEAYARSGDVDKAAQTYRGLADREGSTFPRDQALLQLGKLLRDSKRHAEARQAWQDLLAKFPQSAGANEARSLLEGGDARGQ